MRLGLAPNVEAVVVHKVEAVAGDPNNTPPVHVTARRAWCGGIVMRHRRPKSESVAVYRGGRRVDAVWIKWFIEFF